MPLQRPPGMRRRAVLRGRESSYLLDALLETVESAVVAFDAGFRVTHTNAAARHLVGLECAAGSAPEIWIDELAPRIASGLRMPREDLPPVRALAGEIVHGVDVLARIRGEDVLLGVRAKPAIDAKGRIHGTIVVLEDVSERRRREALQRACKSGAAR
ncbi:MAG TPA: PAS domain-containing protein [Solirubrobacteraceae bacterium]|nr:PAS domain-containing protein [Solirubrobacteraceae bacterium]